MRQKLFSRFNTRKTLSLIMILVVLTDVLVFISAVNAVEVIAIMPLGDSNTKGFDNVGYRQKLYLDLTGAGFNVNFTGSQSDPSSPDPPFDTDHEGYAGWHADGIRDNVYNWLVDNPSDMVLLHIGTNDISNGDENVTEVEDILNIIDLFESNYSMNITVFLARIILRTDDPALNETTKAFNDAVSTMAQGRITNGDDIIIVDMENALTYPNDMIDAKHPNTAGYEKMANMWYNAIYSYLTKEPVADFNAIPSFGSEPLTVNFTDLAASSDGIVSWFWDFGDGENSSTQNPSHVYAEGTYTVSLTVWEGDGDNDTETKVGYITASVQGVIFSDAFESGDFSAWDGEYRNPSWETLEVTTNPVNNGLYAARSAITGNTIAQCWRYIGVSDVVFQRQYVSFEVLPVTEGNLVGVSPRMRYGGSTQVAVSLKKVAGGFQWGYWRRGFGWTFGLTRSVVVGEWYSVELEYDSVEGAIRLWVDGVLEVEESGLSLNPVDTIYTGLSYDTVDPVSAVFDDVVVANQYIGP